jgi:flagellar motility protein MotE (MotC chaperone)
MLDAYQSQRKEWHPASAVRVATDIVQPGIYLFVIMRITLKHPVLSKEELLFRVVETETEESVPATESEALLNQILDNGSTWTSANGFPDYSAALGEALHMISRDCTTSQEAFAEELELRINTKRSKADSHFTRQLETQHRRLENMEKSQDSRKQDIVGTRTRIRNLEARYKEELEQLDSSSEISPEFKRVACGIIKTTALR